MALEPYANVKNSVYPQSSINLTRYIVGEARWKNFEQVKLMVKKGSHGEFRSETLRFLFSNG